MRVSKHPACHYNHAPSNSFLLARGCVSLKLRAPTQVFELTKLNLEFRGRALVTSNIRAVLWTARKVGRSLLTCGVASEIPWLTARITEDSKANDDALDGGEDAGEPYL